MINYVSLHNHSSFSLMRGLVKPIDLFKRAKELGQPAIAVTDVASFAGMWDCLSASKETGVKLIAGCEFNFVNDVKDEGAKLRSIVLLAKNAIGYKNILTLNKKGFDNATLMFKKPQSRIDWDLLKEYSEGVICLTSDGNGIIAQLLMNRDVDEARAQIIKLRDIFGDDFGLELQPHDMARKETPYSGEIDQRFINKKLKELGNELNIRCVITTGVHYLNKSHHSSHDVVLSIASGQPVGSYNRLRFDVDEFYLKSAVEAAHYFVRKKHQYSPEFIQEAFENTIILSDRCEFPGWIDPKHSNPSGKELPEFPVKDAADYPQFLEWKKTHKDNHLDDDTLYLRYRCIQGMKVKAPKDKFNEYKTRLIEELDVLEHHGFSSYMLIVSDYVQWAREQGIGVGSGRGCLSGDSGVLTTKGFKKLKNISVGDNIFTHKGRIRKVLNTFEYDIDEECVDIKSEFSFGTIQMTKDHEVYAIKAQETTEYNDVCEDNLNSLKKVKRRKEPGEPSWYPISSLKNNDLIFTPYPVGRDILNPNKIDLAEFVEGLDFYDVLDNKITRALPLKNKYSIRSLTDKSDLSRNAVQNIKRRGSVKQSTIDVLENNLEGLSADEWAELNNTEACEINRFIEVDNDFCYLMGRWVGDGWCMRTAEGSYETGFNFHSEDLCGINKITSILKRYNISVRSYKALDKKLTQLIVINPLLVNLFKKLVPDYKQASNTKHLPTWFRTLPNNLLLDMLHGLMDSDEHVHYGESSCVRESISTTSHRLVCEIKEALLYLKIPSGVYTRKQFMIDNYLCKQSYKINFKGVKTRVSWRRGIDDKGYFNKIIEIKSTKEIKKVYDITVKEDNSYVTSNYAVHNSVGGCLVAYLIDIHIADPVKYNLIFSRFHNKEKTSYPDIDLDFATAGRDRVIEYIRNKYGEDFVAHVSNVNTITPKVYVRDIARTFEFGDAGRSVSAEIGNQIADTIPTECKTIKSAMEFSPLFAAWADEYPRLKEFEETIGGIARAWSTHAGGVVIGRRALTGLVPLRKDKEGSLALEYEKERAEENGLVKMDVLGLTTLDIIEDTYRIIDLVGKPLPPKMPNFEEYDEKAYDLISRGDTFCIFQLTGVAAPVCKMLQPKSIYDLALITALIRPAAKDIIPEFMEVRSGKKKLALMHPTLERALKGTYGFGLFEECLMYIAADVAGWDLHKADDLRKMTKGKGKYPEKVKKLRKDFIQDAQDNKGLAKNMAIKIWDELINKFGSYGFNLSHAFLYSIITFYTAYLKAHYPLEFLVANLMFEVKSNSPKAKNNILRIKEEIRALGVNIVPPDLNTSTFTYKIMDEHTLMTGLDALKYIGKDAIPEILEKRPFLSFEDFLTKVDGKKVKAPAVQALSASGSLDEFGLSRKVKFLYASDYKKKLQVYLKKKEKNDSIEPFNYPFPKDEHEWSESEKFALEVYYLGEGLSGTLNERYPGFFKSGNLSYEELNEIFPWKHIIKSPLITEAEHLKKVKEANNFHVGDGSYVNSIKGIVRSIFQFVVKKKTSKILGQEMAIITIQDHLGNDMNLIAFPNGLQRIHSRLAKLSGGKHTLEEGIALKLQGVFQHENEYTYSFIFNDILDYSPIPSLPADRKARKIKLPRTKKVKKNIKKMKKEELLEELEDEMIEEGIDPIDDPDVLDEEYMFKKEGSK